MTVKAMLLWMFATRRRKRLAREIATDALSRHDYRAADVLESKARQARSWDSRIIYRLACQSVERGQIRRRR
jgi:hypothetical protein